MKNFTPSPKEHVFFSSMAVIIVLEVIIGFSNTYLPKIMSDTTEVPRIIHVHALAFATWLAFFLFQVTLVLRKKTDLHTRLGNWGVLYSLVMLVVGCAAAIEAARLGHKGIPGVEFPDAGAFLLLNVNALIVFALLTGLGWLNRNNPAAHKRFMLMATAGGLTPPGIARLPFIAGSVTATAIAVLVMLFAGPIYDFIRYRKIHWAYLASVLIVVFSLPPVVQALSGTGLWKKIADLLVHS